jgi:hypothetical protein
MHHVCLTASLIIAVLLLPHSLLPYLLLLPLLLPHSLLQEVALPTTAVATSKDNQCSFNISHE